jgi:uncharacterized membrane protein
MFIGHFAVGFAAKRVAPRVSLAVLFAAAQFADLLWPVLVALGLEQVRIDPGNTAFTPLDFVSYPYSHSLALLVVWGLVYGAVYRAASGRNGRAFAIIAALVVSHWMLDFIVHRPDLPLYPGGPKFGLGLWNSVTGTILVEIAMYAAGLWIYAQATRARDGVGRWGFIFFAVFLLIVYLLSSFGPPPPSVEAIWTVALVGGVILLLWSEWLDRHREA